MMARWCISIFVFMLTLFGVVNQQQAVVPNQEIVLKFTEAGLSSGYAQSTISAVKAQLRDLGAKNIRVNTQKNGSVNIAYHSQSDAASIKKILLKDPFLAFGISKAPKTEDSPVPLKDAGVYCNFDVFEIQNNNDSGRNLKGNLVLQVDTKSDRFVEPNSFLALCQTHQNGGVCATLAYVVRKNIALAIKETPHKIPDGRAGPILL